MPNSKQNRWFVKTIVVLTASIVITSCSYLGLGDDNNNDPNLFWAALLLLNTSSTSTTGACENKSGFVICIPKGVTFQ